MATKQTAPVVITFPGPSTTPPVFVAGSFTEWEPVELDHRTSDKDGVVVHEYSKSFEVSPGEHQYKFRLGPGDWWVCDDTSPQVKDMNGNENNLLVAEAPKKVVEALPVTEDEDISTTPQENTKPSAEGAESSRAQEEEDLKVIREVHDENKNVSDVPETDQEVKKSDPKEREVSSTIPHEEDSSANSATTDDDQTDVTKPSTSSNYSESLTDKEVVADLEAMHEGENESESSASDTSENLSKSDVPEEDVSKSSEQTQTEEGLVSPLVKGQAKEANISKPDEKPAEKNEPVTNGHAKKGDSSDTNIDVNSSPPESSKLVVFAKSTVLLSLLAAPVFLSWFFKDEIASILS